MLLALLDGHPQLNVFPADSGFFYAYFPLYENPEYTREQRIQRVADFCLGNLAEELDHVHVDHEREFPLAQLRATFRARAEAEPELTSRAMLLAMIEAYRECQPADPAEHRRWVEKTTSSEIYASHIFRWFPEARFIHLVRDPRDNYASLKSGWEVKYRERGGELGFLLESMIERGRFGMELATINQARYGADRYLVLRFEDVVTDPTRWMRTIAEFLGIDFDDVLLRPTVCGRPWSGNNFDGLRFSAPSTTNVERWRQRITPAEAAVLEYHFRDVMLRFGYAPTFGGDEAVDAAVEHYRWFNYHRTNAV